MSVFTFLAAVPAPVLFLILESFLIFLFLVIHTPEATNSLIRIIEVLQGGHSSKCRCCTHQTQKHKTTKVR